MRPCVGLPGLVPPLAKWSDVMDGTYSLADFEMFNQTLDEILIARETAP